MNRAARGRIPTFALYGERATQSEAIDALHVEDIPSRSRKYLWRIQQHRHIGLCQCVYVSVGPVTLELEGSRGAWRGPAAFIIPAGTVHGFEFAADCQGYVLTLDLDRLLSTAGGARPAALAALFSAPRTLDLTHQAPLAARAAGMFGSLLREFRQPDSPASPVAGWLACSALWMLAGAAGDSARGGLEESRDLERVRRFKSLLESHLLQHWPVERYARRLALSESSLNRSCRSATGLSAFDLIQQRLSLEARRRLIYVAGPVSAIAAELGYHDPAYFSRFFRRHNGMSPAAFRRLQLDR
jgi:AraC family transcriptional activator of pobA